MAEEVLTRCGYRCDLCHAYKDNIEQDDQRELLSEGWNRIFGIQLTAEQIYCDGCISSNSDDITLVDAGCKVRSCVIGKAYENCSQCDDFACDLLNDRIVKYDDLVENTKNKISRSDRKNFIKPYENYDRLLELREKNGIHSRMYNKLLTPTFADMRKFIETQEVISLWELLHKYLSKHYNFQQEIKYGGKKYGWYINYKAGSRSILSIHPERKAFMMLLVFGHKELEKYVEVEESISSATATLIENTKKYHDGKWILLRVTKVEQYEDCIKLLAVKRSPR